MLAEAFIMSTIGTKCRRLWKRARAILSSGLVAPGILPGLRHRSFSKEFNALGSTTVRVWVRRT